MSKINIVKSTGFGKREYDFDNIKKLFNEDLYLLKCWAVECGITTDDDRTIYGWPELFERFYAGYCAHKYKTKG